MKFDDNEFDKQFKRTWRMGVVGILFVGLMELFLILVLIWAIIELVQWVTTK